MVGMSVLRLDTPFVDPAAVAPGGVEGVAWTAGDIEIPMRHCPGRLDGKVGIVTGAGSRGPGVGTGKAIAVIFAREGCRVLLADAVIDGAEETLASIRAEGGEASATQVDVTQSGECHQMVEAAVDRYGRLDILVNNVSILAPGNVIDVAEADWDRVIATNLKSMMLTSEYALPHRIAGGGGAIVNLASFMALRAGYESEPVAYSASMGGVLALTTTMASEHGPGTISASTRSLRDTCIRQWWRRT